MPTNQKTPKDVQTEQNGIVLLEATSKAQTEVTVDFNSLRPVLSKQGGYRSSVPSMLTIVNTKQHGKRITLASEVIETIGASSEVTVLLNNSGLVISKALAGSDNPFRLRTSANKYAIYAANLVQEITDAFHLDFSHTTSLSFQNVQYLSREKQTVAFVDLSPQG